jgi:hypothetical protein
MAGWLFSQAQGQFTDSSKVAKLFLCLTKHYAMKTYGGADVQIHVFLTSVLVGGEWLASRPGRFNPRKEPPATHWIGGWMGNKADMDDVKKWKLLTLPELEQRFLHFKIRGFHGGDYEEWCLLGCCAVWLLYTRHHITEDGILYCHITKSDTSKTLVRPLCCQY